MGNEHKALISESRQVLDKVNTLVPNMKQYTRSPEKLLRARQQVAKQIEKLQKTIKMD